MVTVSLPNTPGLRQPQDKGSLLKIFKELQSRIQLLPVPRPIFLKTDLDLSEPQLDEMVAHTQACR